MPPSSTQRPSALRGSGGVPARAALHQFLCCGGRWVDPSPWVKGRAPLASASGVSRKTLVRRPG
eukprot:211404-Pyramimonas_sp.AAC.1